MLKSFVRLVNVDPGFDPSHVLRLDLSLPGPRYPTPQEQKRFYGGESWNGLEALPGVETVGATSQTPLSPGDNWGPVAIDGRPAPTPGQEPYAAMRSVSSEYFRAMRIPLRKGRYFTPGQMLASRFR